MANRKENPDAVQGNRGRGRPRGSKNKTTLAAKEAIEAAAQELGGADRLVEWVREDKDNERVFWGSIYPRLLPLTHTGNVGFTVTIGGKDADL